MPTVPEKIPAKKARHDFTDISDNVAFHGERVIVTRNGRDLFAWVPISDLRTLQAMEDKADIEDAKKAEAYIKKHGTISWSEMEKRLGIGDE
ncbi:MAG TPA: type II toxin-antitoxin system prevent-host-death family antitoxin [Chlamydiales bacterium]|nr:type II toxin-antitoxin system prevent-host-death family antitoxin [Chlamydiales bacterium]